MAAHGSISAATLWTAHIDGMAMNERGDLAVVTSHLTSNHWKGELRVIRSAEQCLSADKTTLASLDQTHAENVCGASTPSGSTGVCWVAASSPSSSATSSSSSSPAAPMLLVSSDGGSVDLYNLLDTGELTLTTRSPSSHDDLVSCALVLPPDMPSSSTASPESPLCILSGSHDCTIRLAQLLPTTKSLATLRGHQAPVTCAATMTLGGCVALLSGSRDGAVFLWSEERKQQAQEWRWRCVAKGGTPAGGVRALCAFGDVAFVGFESGLLVAIGTLDNTDNTAVWTSTAATAAANGAASMAVSCMALGPGGTRLAVGAEDGSVRVLDAATGTLLSSCPTAHTDYVKALAFLPDSGDLVSGGWDGVLRRHSA